ncbi:MotA/TolQ/ExbB proton channel family protein [Ferrimonas marina]|uniref:Biopolymer transport protein ExbB n=1 Tax=Ferrimonas marina TaxID=299255 RepID=A0A1M5YRV4_9GAMM|nr:MotA/TolQ/ExbB proton channel family protein [Ferrimonas marina]SHI14785.1 biopolymer transport protein ExbB [Ferrimonas marina]
MDFLMVLFESVRDFMATGGDVLWLVAAALSVTWILMLERFIYLRTAYPKFQAQLIEQWNARQERKSWTAHRVRETLLSQARVQLHARTTVIAALVAMCPMLGLLGTVTGMINVFEVMAVHGTGNARMMASGISMATIPTMAGMVAALSGVFFSARLNAEIKMANEKLNDHLPFD